MNQMATNPQPNIQQPTIQTVEDGMGTRQVVSDYTLSEDRPGYYVVPSGKNSVGLNSRPDNSGLTISGFDPLAPTTQIIDPDNGGQGYAWTPGVTDYPYADQPGAASQQVQPIAIVPPVAQYVQASAMQPIGTIQYDNQLTVGKPLEQQSQPPNTTTDYQPPNVQLPQQQPQPEIPMYLHVSGMKVPYRFHQVIIEPRKHLLVLVSDMRSNTLVPEFSPTPAGEHIIFSTPDHPNLLKCSYGGQSFVIGDTVNVDVLILEDEIPKE